MKIATLFFNHAKTARAYRDALRERMYMAGYKPHQVTDIFRDWFPPKKLTAYISGTDDAERAVDVAGEVHGVRHKITNVP
jgi:hypothetical protein